MNATIWARRFTIGIAATWVVVLAVVFALRVGFALELEWMEGGALLQARRIQQGLPIYGPPSPDYVPHLYTPFYAYVLAALGSLLPLGFVLARLVSIGAILAVCAALWRLVGYEGKPRAHRAAAVGLFLSSYVFTFRWMDLARIDALFLALTLWGLCLLREGGEHPRKLALAGLLMALAFWTKQTAFVFVLASGVGGLVVAPRRLWIYATPIAVLAGGGVLVGNAMTDGWLWTWIYELHQQHAFNAERFRRKTWGMFVHAAPFLALLVPLVVAELVRRGSRADTVRGALYWGVLAIAGLLVSALGYSTQWAEANAFLPGVCLGAAFLAVALPVNGSRETLALALVGAQMVFALVVEPLYQPIQDAGLSAIGRSYAWQRVARTVPSAEQRRAAAALRERIEALDGELLALHRPWWNVLSGGVGHVGVMNLHDVADADADALRSALRGAIEEGRYAAVWLEGEPPPWLRRALGRRYVLEERREGDARVRPMSGYMSDAGMVSPYHADQLWLRRR